LGVSASAQDQPSLPQARGETDFINFRGQVELQYDDLALVPRQLSRALDRSCSYKEAIKKFPVRLVSAEVGRTRHRFAIVFCEDISGFHQVYFFARGWFQEPTLVQFPYLAADRGFGVTSSPGFVTWNPETQTLQAERGSDVPSPRLRYTYRFGHTWGGELPFVLERVESSEPDSKKDGPWSMVWEAPTWPASAYVR
jgi:hypothetical protein